MRDLADRAARRRREERGETRPEAALLTVDCPGGRAFVDTDSLAYDIDAREYIVLDGSWIRARPHVIEDLRRWR